jgi:hypothetical protein
MGVAESVSTSTFFLSCFQLFFVSDAETLFFIDNDEAEFGKLDVVREDPVRADEDINIALFGGSDHGFCSFAERKRESSSTRAGNAANRLPKVSKC